MALLYAPRALLGLLTPQANTTVEPEVGLLLPPGFGQITARLTSRCASMDDRLIDYFARIADTAAQFANAPVAAIGFACTGASYLVGAGPEAQALATLSTSGKPVISAGQAIAQALRALGATRIAIASPYGAALTDRAADYWHQHGFTLTRIEPIAEDRAAFHPIYAHSADHVATATTRLLADPSGAEAIVLLGTGLPTLPALVQAADATIPVLSSNLCLAWALCHAATGTPADAASLHHWRKGHHWQARLATALP
ncbi:hypothetical protein [Gemmobacter sp.]|uniref:maleate cis-trans isomerase family protein n=1 Tax=Gemmobacter sp. TaxID=1898957 RepID=UPI002AFE924C|nr:hypothetical protein [Gemmobacter sp.]